MPVFSCGGMRYQESWQDMPLEKIPEANQRNLEATIRRSLEVGINHIETARGYGTSEMQLGRILPTIPRDQLIVQTKVAPAGDGTEFLQTFEKSMDYLRLDHVELLSLHGINTRELLENSQWTCSFYRILHAWSVGCDFGCYQHWGVRLRESPLVLGQSAQLASRSSR